MRRDKLDIQTVEWANENHPWYGQTVYQIMLKASGTRNADPRIKGCPLGSGLTEEYAYMSLRNQVLVESGVDIGDLTEASPEDLLDTVEEQLRWFDDHGETEGSEVSALESIRETFDLIKAARRRQEEEAATRRSRLYRVWLRHERSEYACVTVEAGSADEARKLAVENADDADWEPVECNEPYVTEVEKVED